MSETNAFNPYDAGMMDPPANPGPPRYSPVQPAQPAGPYNPYDTGAMGVTGSLEERMTPGPVTQTAYDQLPTKDSDGQVRLGAVKRIRDATTGAWRDANVFTPEYQEKMNRSGIGGGWLNRNVINPALNTAAAIPAAGGAMIGSTIEELSGAAGAPGLGRDVNAAFAALSPIAAAAAPFMPRALMPGREKPGERFVPGSRTGPLNPEAIAEMEARRAARAGEPNPPFGGMRVHEGETEPTMLTYREKGVLPGTTVTTKMPPQGPMPPPPGYIPPTTATGLAKDAFAVGEAHYDLADHLGGRVSAKANEAFLDNKLSKIRTQDAAARRFDPNDAVDASIADLNNALRGHDLSLRGTQEIDKKIGDRIEVALRAGKNDEASRLVQMQHALRDHVESVGEAETTGGPAGFAALKDARRAWSIAVRMQDIERMVAKAQDTQNPQVTLRNAINRYTNDERMTRGWSKEDLDLLKKSAKTSDGMEILRGMASRLVPIGGYAVGGPVGGLVGLATDTVIANRARDALGGIYAKRLGRVNEQLSTHLPGMPGSQVGPPAPPAGVLMGTGQAMPRTTQRGLLGSMAFGTDQGELRRQAEERAQLEEQLRLRREAQVRPPVQ